jgi:hypothetical protein
MTVKVAETLYVVSGGGVVPIRFQGDVSKFFNMDKSKRDVIISALLMFHL